MFSTNPSKTTDLPPIIAPSHNLSESSREFSNFSHKLRLNVALADHTYCIPTLPYNDNFKLVPEELYIDDEFIEEVVVGTTEFHCPRIKDEGVDLEITEPSINLNVDSPENLTGDQKLHLHCRVEIPDIRETLYCYECGEWSLTAENLTCHIINHSKSSTNGEQILESVKLSPKSPKSPKIFPESVLDEFQEKNQHLINCYNDASEQINQNECNNSNKIFPCDLCDRFFSKKCTLNIHKSVHQIKPFACEMCGSSFDNERTCALHVLKHADIQPHDTYDTLQIKCEKESEDESGCDLVSESVINGEKILENEQHCIKDKQLLPCKVEIPDIRDELYCYDCEEWCLTADALHHHKLKMHGFCYEVDQRVFEQFQAENQQTHLKALNKIYDESIFEKISAQNQYFNAHNDESQQENQMYEKIKETTKAQEIKQKEKGERQKRKQSHKERFNSNKIFTCDLCDKSFTKKYTLNIHKRIHIIKPFTCEMCGSSFDNERACAIHVLKHAGIQPHHTSETLQIKSEKESQEESGYDFVSESVINGEKRLENEQHCIKDKQLLPCKVEIPDIRDDLYCYKCEEWFITANALHCHKLEMHGLCHEVDEQFFEEFQAENQRIHPKGLNKIYDERIFEKFSAENQFFNAYNDESQQENQNYKNIKYTTKTQGKKRTEIGERLKKKKGLKERCNSSKIFTCDLCDKSFAKKYTLNIHKSIHIIKPFTCEMCGSSFDNERACAIHVLKHAGIQPHHYNTTEEPQIKREKESQEENSNLTLNENVYCDVDKIQAENQQLNPLHDKSQKENPNFNNIFYYDVDESVFEQFQAENQQMHCYPNKDLQEECHKKRFVCDYCRKHFFNKLTLREHIYKCSTDCKSRNAKIKHKHSREQGLNKMFSCDLCNKCFSRKHQLKAHKRAHQAKPFSCEICGLLFNTEHACAIHELKHATEKVEKQSCNICDRVLKSKEELNKHKISHNTRRDLKYICELCGRDFARKSNLITHIENRCGTVPKSSNRNDKRKKRKIAERRFPCNLCNKSFTRQWCLNVHKHAHERKPFTCEICDHLFANEKACKIHELLKHAGIKQYQCDHCEKTFAFKGGLRIHMDKHRGYKAYSCEPCKIKFTYECNLKAHNRRFHNKNSIPQKFTCDNCGGIYKCKRYLIKHMLTHYQEWRFPCEHCSRPFRLAIQLESHILNKHTVLRPFECERCTRCFATKHALTNHMRGHDDKTKIHPCDVCGKKFDSKKYQVIHTLRHQGIRNKQFSCETCNKEFEDNSSLKRHKFLRHTDVWPYSCDQCGRRFKLKQTLTLHKIHHSNIKPFVCEICGRRHKTYGARTNHMKIHDHNEHWCDYCGQQFSCKSSVARHIFGYCKKSGQKRISKKFS